MDTNYQTKPGIVKRIEEMRQKQMTYRQIAHAFNREGMTGPTGRKICQASISHFMISIGARLKSHAARKAKARTNYEPRTKTPDTFLLETIASKELTREQKIKVLQALL